MKNLLKKTVPALLALLLLVTPTSSVLADEAGLYTPDGFTSPAIAKIAEEETDATTPAPAEEPTETPEASSDQYYNHVWPTPAEIDSESALVLENSTSSVLYEKDADTMRYPASTTKILTALLAIENSSLDEVVTFSENAVNLEAGATNIKAQAGEQMSMRDVLYGLMLPSGNDCAVAIAEHVAGSVEAFSDMMNERAQQIGCTASHFSNPHGLFASDHYTTARDMAKIAQEAFNNSTFVDIISTPVYHADATNMSSGRTFTNTNLLLDPESDYYDPDVIGGKTGFLDEAGRCLVTFGSRDGFTVITVQLKGGYEQVFGSAKTLMDFAFDNFTMQNVSANERRFSYPVADAKVVLDPAAQILTLSSIPFDQLESELVFAEDLGVDRKIELSADATEDGRTLYGLIDYSYDGHELGSANIYLDPSLEIAPAAFTTIFYISPLYLVIFIILILVLIFTFYGAQKNKKRPATEPRRRPPSAAGYRKETPSQRREDNYRSNEYDYYDGKEIQPSRNYYYRKRKR